MKPRALFCVKSKIFKGNGHIFRADYSVEIAFAPLLKRNLKGKSLDLFGSNCFLLENRRDGNDQEPIQLSHTSHQRHQRERNTNMK